MKQNTPKTNRKSVAKNRNGKTRSARSQANLVKHQASTRSSQRSRVHSSRQTSAKQRHLSKKGIIASIIGIVILIAAIIGLVVFCARNNSEPEPAPDDEISQVEPPEEEPKEPEPVINTDPLVKEPTITDPATYQVAAHKPRFLSIPSLSLYNIPVTEVGMWSGKQLGSPTSTRVVAWYYRSALPGEKGVSVMDAHGGDLGTGIFKTLPRAKVGDEVLIEMGDGRKFTYIIKEMVYKKLGTEANKYMDTVYLPLSAETPTLSMITCTGKWLPDKQTYDLRLFVRAALKQ